LLAFANYIESEFYHRMVEKYGMENIDKLKGFHVD